MRKLNYKGFTIIELLIATVIFSVILLVITGAIVQFGQIYYKGVIQSRTQERARAITEDISKSIQFSGNDPHPALASANHLCVGDRRYTWTENVQLSATQRVLVADDAPGCTGPYTGMNVPLPTGKTELAGEKMQLLNLEVIREPANPSLFTIKVRLAYGNSSDMTGTPQVCRTINLGGQYCAITELTTTVTRRLK
jgi:prepilin-type N-terminal cleavage/methylation domain-containing protein